MRIVMLVVMKKGLTLLQLWKVWFDLVGNHILDAWMQKHCSVVQSKKYSGTKDVVYSVLLSCCTISEVLCGVMGKCVYCKSNLDPLYILQKQLSDCSWENSKPKFRCDLTIYSLKKKEAKSLKELELASEAWNSSIKVVQPINEWNFYLFIYFKLSMPSSPSLIFMWGQQWRSNESYTSLKR